MSNIHIHPDKIAAAANDINIDLDQWQAQHDSYTAAQEVAHASVARGFAQGAQDNWFGGPGENGYVQGASQQFLPVFLKELDRLVAEKAEFIGAVRAYVTAMAGMAHGIKAADDAAAEQLSKILQDLEGGH